MDLSDAARRAASDGRKRRLRTEGEEGESPLQRPDREPAQQATARHAARHELQEPPASWPGKQDRERPRLPLRRSFHSSSGRACRRRARARGCTRGSGNLAAIPVAAAAGRRRRPCEERQAHRVRCEEASGDQRDDAAPPPGRPARGSHIALHDARLLPGGCGSQGPLSARRPRYRLGPARPPG